MKYSDIQIGLRPGEEVKPAKKTSDPWREEAWEKLKELIAQGGEFSADDLLDCLDHPDPEHQANSSNSRIGPLFLKAQRAGLIEATGRSVMSQQSSRHAGRIQVWRPVRKRHLVRIGGSNGHS